MGKGPIFKNWRAKRHLVLQKRMFCIGIEVFGNTINIIVEAQQMRMLQICTDYAKPARTRPNMLLWQRSVHPEQSPLPIRVECRGNNALPHHNCSGSQLFWTSNPTTPQRHTRIQSGAAITREADKCMNCWKWLVCVATFPRPTSSPVCLCIYAFTPCAKQLTPQINLLHSIRNWHTSVYTQLATSLIKSHVATLNSSLQRLQLLEGLACLRLLPRISLEKKPHSLI